jgi:glutamine amidotransferase
MIALVDYYAGNVRSIENAFRSLGAEVKLARKPGDLEKADAIILPGVGNFGDAMRHLRKYEPTIRREVEAGKPFLGLCLGIQVILEKSEESPRATGLGLLEGGCRRFKGRMKVPHMGWNTVDIIRKSPLFKGIKTGSYFYFVHSYYPLPVDREATAASTEYGVAFPSAIVKDNVMATQFHPEKSGDAGLRLLKNFVDLV